MNQKIPCRFDLEIPVRPKGGIDGVIVTLNGELPFIPTIGMFLTAIPDDDYRQVEGVYWSQKDGLTVFFKFDEHAKLSRLKKLGWKEIP